MARINLTLSYFEHIHGVIPLVPTRDNPGHVWILLILFLVFARVPSVCFNFSQHFVLQVGSIPVGAIGFGFIISEWDLVSDE